MKADIEWLGFFGERGIIEGIVSELSREGVVAERNYRIGKLLISEEKRPGVGINLTIEDIDDFIRQRMHKYNDPKYAARHMFPNDLLQYIIWSEKHKDRR